MGNTLLHTSTRLRLRDFSQLLVDSVCKINVRNNVGETPLHSAVRAKNVADVKLLLKKNADPNIQDIEGNTPLHISSRRRFSNISQLLIDSGSNTNLKNQNGKTPRNLKPFFRYPPYAGDSEEAKGNEGDAYASQIVFRLKGFFESEDLDDAWMNQPTRSTDSGYASRESSRGRIVVESEYEDDALGKRETIFAFR